jgi:hypothetical protein
VRLVRLVGLCTLSALLTSRVTLIVHELIGHGAVARAFGAEIVEIGLFLFAGGWIRYEHGPWGMGQALATSLGGIGLEILLGIAALVLARRPARGSPLRFGLAAFGAIDLVHAGYYLATGAHHGYGDGFAVHHILGESRPWLVIPASAATVAAAYLVARRLGAEAEPWLAGGTRGRRLASLLVAALAAGAVHGALAVGETRLFPQGTYQKVKETESDRDVARELAAWRAAALRRGVEPDAEALARAREKFEAEHRQFPLMIVLGILVAIACAAGAVRVVGGGATPAASDGGSIAPLAVACLASIGLVGLLKLLL